MYTTRTLLITVALLTIPLSAASADPEMSSSSSPPERVSFLVTFGDDECPTAVGDEIVVCASAPESDRYRIPKDLRKDEEVAVSGGSSWTFAVESLDGYSRAILPNSCSVNGSNGFSGCTQAALAQWFADRRGKSDAN